MAALGGGGAEIAVCAGNSIGYKHARNRNLVIWMKDWEVKLIDLPSILEDVVISY